MPAGTLAVDPSQVQPWSPQSGLVVSPGDVQPYRQPAVPISNAPAKAYSLPDLASSPSRTALPPRNPLIPPAAEPDVDAIKKKYGLPATVDLSKGFFDPANRDISGDQAEAFSSATRELQSFAPKQPAQTLTGSLAEEGKNLLMGATAPPDSPFSATEVPLIGGPVTQFTDPVSRALAEWNQGHRGRAALEAAGAVPIVGPMITGRGEDIAQGHYRRAAGAGLADAAALLPFALGHEPEPDIPGATYDRANAASEPVVAGNTVPDHLANLRQRITSQIADTERQDRINAPVNVPPVPETTEPPVIVPPRAVRTPMQELSEQAAEARRPQE